ATGPGGAASAVGRAGAAVGAMGAVAGKAGAAVGPGGAAAGRAGVATGPGGTVAGRTGIAATSHGTYYRSAAAISGQGAYVRQNFGYYNSFRPGWYVQHPGAWAVAGLTAAAIWAGSGWGTVYSECG